METYLLADEQKTSSVSTIEAESGYPIRKDSFEITILQKEHIESVIDLITKSFCDDEPMTRYVNMRYVEFSKFARQITEKAAQDGLSIVALEANKVVACTIVEDITDPADLSIDLTEKFKPIFGLLERLTENFYYDKLFKRNELAHLFITAVHPQHRGKKLSNIVNFETMRLAALRNFDFMCCEFTNILNEKGTVKHIPIKQLIGSCTYNQFELNNQKPFANLEGCANAYVWPLHKETKLVFKKKPSALN